MSNERKDLKTIGSLCEIFKLRTTFLHT